jgi:Zinc finger, C2H2 type/Zinc-finger of C2H2 type
MMLPVHQEGCLLKDVVRIMMAQICKVGVPYNSDLLIEGTVTVTVDKQKVIVIHFDDRLLSQSATVTANDTGPGSSSDVNSVAEGFRSAISELTGRHFSAAAADASASATGAVINQSVNNSGWFIGSSSTKMMTCLNETLNERVAIDLDSEEDNPDMQEFNDIEFPDVSNCTAVVEHPIFPNTTSSKKTCRKVKDAKNVIVIEDGELLETVCDVSEATDELKLLDGFSSRYLLPYTDCESVADSSDARSLLNNVNQASEPTMLRCEMCGWQARRTSQLESHLVARHGVVDSTQLGRHIAHTACSLCGKRFRFQAQLDKHRLRHGSMPGERSHRCTQCRNTYSNAQSLVLHSQVHGTNVSRLSCVVCNKTYANKVLFQKHIVYMHERTGFPANC